MIRTNGRMRLCTGLIVGILVFIWGNSLMSAEASHAFSQWVKALLARFLPKDSPVIRDGSGLLRKIAHFTEFAALGFCLAWRCGMNQSRPHRSFAFGAAAAVMDETIQCFVPGRGPSMADVLLDSSGVLTGMLLLFLGHTLLTLILDKWVCFIKSQYEKRGQHTNHIWRIQNEKADFPDSGSGHDADSAGWLRQQDGRNPTRDH